MRPYSFVEESVEAYQTEHKIVSDHTIEEVKKQSYFTRAVIATPDVLSPLFGNLWFFASRKNLREYGSVLSHPCTIMESGLTGLVIFRYFHDRLLLEFDAMIATQGIPSNIVERHSIRDFEGSDSFRRVYLNPISNCYSIFVAGEAFHLVTGSRMVARKREYIRGNLQQVVYVYNTKDPTQLPISIDVFVDVGLARRICDKVDWAEANSWREAHPFHGLFWSDCTLYGISDLLHKASNSIAIVLEVRAKNMMLSTFQNRDDLYEPLFKSLNYPKHPDWKDAKLMEIYDILRLDYSVEVNNASVLDALINAIIDKILEVRPKIELFF